MQHGEKTRKIIFNIVPYIAVIYISDNHSNLAQLANNKTDNAGITNTNCVLFLFAFDENSNSKFLTLPEYISQSRLLIKSFNFK